MIEPLRVLVVEDDEPIRRGVVDALEVAGYRPSEAKNGEEGLEAALDPAVDLVLLDVLMPRLDGFEVLRRLRGSRPGLPVIMLTARGTEEDRVRGLTTGADDYVVKPFSARELLARVEAVLRRSPARPSGVAGIEIAGRRIDFDRCEAELPCGEVVGLSERETALLRHLSQNANRVVTRKELLSMVWGVDPRGMRTRAIDMAIARLREVLGDDPKRPEVIQTVRARGYMLVRGNGVAQ